MSSPEHLKRPHRFVQLVWWRRRSTRRPAARLLVSIAEAATAAADATAGSVQRKAQLLDN